MRLYCLLIALLMLANLAAAGQDESCQLRAREAKDCSLCCATGGFNKFDAAKFAAGRGCTCYTDRKELAANERHKQRRP